MNTSARASSKAPPSSTEDLATTLFPRVILWCVAPARIDRAGPEGAAPVGTRATTLSDARVAISDSRVPGRVRIVTSTTQDFSSSPRLYRCLGPGAEIHIRGRRG